MVVLSCPHCEHRSGYGWRIMMQNDLDLMRAILESVRDRQDLRYRRVELAGYDQLLVGRHVERLYDDGMLDGTKTTMISEPVARIAVRDLTKAGHQFLSAMESGDVWARLKSALSPTEISALSLRELAGIAKELAAKAIRKKLGLD